MFYFDKRLAEYERRYEWDNALIHLEKCYNVAQNQEVLNSLVGFSWYYLIEGPIDSGKYDKDENDLPLVYWEKYLEYALKEKRSPEFCFIAGYTLLLHGYYLQEYQKNNEAKGLELLKEALKSDNPDLRIVADGIIKRATKDIKIEKAVISRLFCGESLLERYFRDVL